MDTVVIVGNCQAKALEVMLATNEQFSQRFEFVSFPAVHEIDPATVPALHEAVAAATIVMPQRVDEGYRDGLGLGTETLARIAGRATVVRWPSVYWAGYFPDLFYLRDAAGRPVVDGPFDYHDRLILRAFAEGLEVSAVCCLMADAERPSNAPEWAAHATAELDVRGRDCDIDVAPFIASHFRSEMLFFSMNHPTNRLLAFIAQEISERIGLGGRTKSECVPVEILSHTFYPLHANHVRSLELSFGHDVRAGNAPFRIRGQTYEAQEAVQAFFAYYAEHPDLVELNLAEAAV